MTERNQIAGFFRGEDAGDLRGDERIAFGQRRIAQRRRGGRRQSVPARTRAPFAASRLSRRRRPS